jgi:hypothetical protein
MATLSERMDAPGNPCWQCEKAEGWTKEVRALETALADEKAGRKLLADATDKLRECEAKLADAVKREQDNKGRDMQVLGVLLLIQNWTIPRILPDYPAELVAEARAKVEHAWAETHPEATTGGGE